MSGDAHVRFWESAGVKLPRATHLPSSPLTSPPAAHKGMSRRQLQT